jgi:hypothetical protein
MIGFTTRFAGDPPADDVTLAKGRGRWQRMPSIRCLFAVIPLFSWLLFLPLWRGRTRVSAANRISVADNSLQKQQNSQRPFGRAVLAICG